MSKTIEFIEKEIKNIKELLELDDVLCELSDNDYKFYNDRLQTFKQIKNILEAWEVVKRYTNTSEDIVNTEYYFIKGLDDEFETLKKALEVKE